ncbi:hypothetical protein A5646_08910 [Mycobacterium sp. 1245499.0]|uniref:hypothetical protein n=1 Tax=Mycobacterium sp. 1245499.0 TaxID=1834074 RepID=UPI0007FE2460|nr:hypothetical protein A5646_08910 [Mycobacterium sp. 1245499.0]
MEDLAARPQSINESLHRGVLERAAIATRRCCWPPGLGRLRLPAKLAPRMLNENDGLVAYCF